MIWQSYPDILTLYMLTTKSVPFVIVFFCILENYQFRKVSNSLRID